MPQEITLGDMVRTRRLALGLTQTDLAERTGLIQTEISRIEHGGVRLPRMKRLQRLAEVLDLPLGVLLAASNWATEDTERTSNEEPTASSH